MLPDPIFFVFVINNFLMLPEEQNDDATRAQAEVKTTISHEEVNSLPLRAFDGKIVLIDDPSKLEKAVQEISKHRRVGFDTETRPSFKKGQHYKVALLQLALDKKVFLIRLNHTGLTDELVSLLENENVVKTGVGLRDDLVALQKLKKFHPKGFEDLAAISKKSGLQVESVKKLTALLLGFRISKSAQTSNWETITLTEKQLEYAATDAWVCLEIHKKLVG
jgi:ribonuclease D